MPCSVTLPFEKSPLTLAAVAGCSILLCRPLFQVSWIVWWHEAQASAPTNAGAPSAGGWAPLGEYAAHAIIRHMRIDALAVFILGSKGSGANMFADFRRRVQRPFVESVDSLPATVDNQWEMFLAAASLVLISVGINLPTVTG